MNFRMSNMNYKRPRVSDRLACGGGYLLIFVVHDLKELRMTDLTQHFGVDLRSVAICCVFVIFLGVFFTFRLEFVRTVMYTRVGGGTSTDRITRRDC